MSQLKKWQNNLILMVIETGSRVFISDGRWAPHHPLQFVFALSHLHVGIPSTYNGSGCTSQRKGKSVTNCGHTVPCLAPPSLDVICSAGVGGSTFHYLPVFHHVYTGCQLAHSYQLACFILLNCSHDFHKSPLSSWHILHTPMFH